MFSFSHRRTLLPFVCDVSNLSSKLSFSAKNTTSSDHHRTGTVNILRRYNLIKIRIKTFVKKYPFHTKYLSQSQQREMLRRSINQSRWPFVLFSSSSKYFIKYWMIPKKNLNCFHQYIFHGSFLK